LPARSDGASVTATETVPPCPCSCRRPGSGILILSAPHLAIAGLESLRSKVQFIDLRLICNRSRQHVRDSDDYPDPIAALQK
jgi:hypothetical protein